MFDGCPSRAVRPHPHQPTARPTPAGWWLNRPAGYGRVIGPRNMASVAAGWRGPRPAPGRRLRQGLSRSSLFLYLRPMTAHDRTPRDTALSWHAQMRQSADTAVAEAGVAVQLLELKQAICGSSPESRLAVAEAWLHLGRLTRFRDALVDGAREPEPAPGPVVSVDRGASRSLSHRPRGCPAVADVCPDDVPARLFVDYVLLLRGVCRHFLSIEAQVRPRRTLRSQAQHTPAIGGPATTGRTGPRSRP